MCLPLESHHCPYAHSPSQIERDMILGRDSHNRKAGLQYPGTVREIRENGLPRKFGVEQWQTGMCQIPLQKTHIRLRKVLADMKFRQHDEQFQ